MAMDSGARVMNGTWGQIWEDGTEIAEVSAFQVKVNKNFDTINICGQMAEDRKLTGVKITGSMTLHKVYSRGADDVEQAIAHIAQHSTGHSDCIVTENAAAARLFQTRVDSAAVYWNASTRFTDGGEFGLGCEMGISTQKLHARGPMGLAALTTYKYVVLGEGQVRG